MRPDENETLPPRPPAAEALRTAKLTAASKAALWQRIEASAVAAAPEAASSPSPPTTPAAASATAAATLKLVVPALVLGAISGVGVDRWLLPPHVQVVEREKVVVQTKEVRVEVPVIQRIEVPGPPPTAMARKERQNGPPQPTPPPMAAQANLERQLLEVARTALVRREPALALQTLDRLRNDFKTGQLAEERESLRVQALQQAGREEEARDAAQAFLKQFPESVFGPSMTVILKP